MSRKTGIVAAVSSIALLALVASFLWSSREQSDTIKIATKPMTEQFILGEMLALLIEEKTALKAVVTKGIGGGTANIHPALLKGEFDLYPEYTGTAWSYVLKETTLPDDAALYKTLVEEYRKRFNLEWVGLYGFNNTYGLVVRKEIADRHHLATYSDLAAVSSDLVFGAEYDFYEREDGYEALSREYGYAFKKRRDLDIGLKYAAIGSGEIDVMNIFTTDGQLSIAPVTILRDDRKFYRTYYSGTVVRAETLEKHPEIKDVLMMMEGLITESEMARLNYEVEGMKRAANDVARAFLQTKNLIR